MPLQKLAGMVSRQVFFGGSDSVIYGVLGYVHHRIFLCEADSLDEAGVIFSFLCQEQAKTEAKSTSK